MKKPHIKLIGREGDVEWYEISVGGKHPTWRCRIGSFMAATGGKWRELALSQAQYVQCISTPAIAH
jgi:hypothetical protein